MNKVTDIIVDPDSFVSLHAQLHSQLRHLILSARWQRGTRIPSENEFTTHLKVSRSTVRLALQKAEIEGLIERIAGRGTFVAYNPPTNNQNRLIAFITYQFDSESHLLLLKGAESVAKARGYQIILTTVQSHEEELDVLQRLHGEYIAGVLLWPNANASHPESSATSSYKQIRLPMVLMDRLIYGMACDCVTSDNYGGAQSLMRHLIGLGHQQIVFLAHHEMELLTVQERYRGYRDALLEAGLKPSEPLLVGQPGVEIGGSDAFRSMLDMSSPELQQIKNYLLQHDPCPTAIFALNDYLAILTARALKLLGMRVPEAISVAGFDDIDLAAHLEVPLTTVYQDMFAMGRRAAELLLDRLDGYTRRPDCDIIPTQLRIRASTAVPLSVSPEGR